MAESSALAAETFAVVLAGGRGTRLDPLTRHVCKPALPFGGGFRSIDFTLSNCANSGIGAVGVATQYKPATLLAHLATRWRRTRDFVVVPWHADDYAPDGGYRGTADAVYRNLARIDACDPRLVLILAGDHVYSMDYRRMLEEHCAHGADVTIGCVEVPTEDARHFGVLTLGDDGRVERFIEKPSSTAELPRTTGATVLASMGIYVFNAAFLARTLAVDAHTASSRHDFGGDILPTLIGHARVYAHRFRGRGEKPYWRDIGTLHGYWQAHMDLLDPAAGIALADAEWPIGASAAPRAISAPVATRQQGVVEQSIVGARCTIGGRVRRSVLADDVEVARGASVVDCVVLPGAYIGAGSRLRGVIVDQHSRVADGTALETAVTSNEPLVLTSATAHEERYALTA